MELTNIITKINDRIGKCSIYASPGRINLIGEHTDYNGGFVLPAAVDKSIYAGFCKNGTKTVRLYSIDMNDYAEFDLSDNNIPSKLWARYIFGVCREIIKRGYDIDGFDSAFAGNIPIGAGMSSSAALESVYGFSLSDMYNLNIDKKELAKIGQATEHNYCGVKCGIMDQFASIFGKTDNLIRLDCRSLEYKYFPFAANDYKLVLINSGVKHELAETAYNRRRESCENVINTISKAYPNVKLLRDVNAEMLLEFKNKLTAEDYKRAQYVVAENQRVIDVCEALENSDFEAVGKKMYETHNGMSKIYEVSCVELDYLNEIAKKCNVTGSRAMGGGFGGCTINLVLNHFYDAFIEKAKSDYFAKFNIKADIYNVVLGDGTRKLTE